MAVGRVSPEFPLGVVTVTGQRGLVVPKTVPRLLIYKAPRGGVKPARELAEPHEPLSPWIHQAPSSSALVT